MFNIAHSVTAQNGDVIAFQLYVFFAIYRRQADLYFLMFSVAKNHVSSRRIFSLSQSNLLFPVECDTVHVRRAL